MEQSVIKDGFKGSRDYIASLELQQAVDIAVALEKPLLIKGEPGTGKTMLAKAVADHMGKRLIVWNIKSTTKAQEGLYVYDTVQRLYDSQFGDGDVSDIARYIKPGKLGEAFMEPAQAVLLIDEIDKADLEFPNDLLWELDQMEYYIPETRRTVRAQVKPVVIITSNAEKELPDAFLRRCIFHYIAFPGEERMTQIVNVHYPDIQKNLLDDAMKVFYEIRAIRDIRKKPATSEFLDWLQALVLAGIAPEDIQEQLPLMGVILKKNQDIDALNSAYEK